MDLNLEIIRTSGRATIPVNHTYVGPLTEADIAALDLPRNTAPSAIARLTQRHHALARTLASGRTVSEAAFICGYEIARVSTLQSDPTFKELLAFYRKDVDRQYADFHATLAGMSHDAAEEIRRRLEDNPEDINLASLIDITKLGADRTGYGPSSKSEVNVTVGMADRLRLARERVAQRNVIDITPDKEAV